MLFLILLFVSIGILGITVIMIDRRTTGQPVPVTDYVWFHPSISKMLEQVSSGVENLIRDGLRVILSLLLHLYRTVNARLHIKSYIKRRLREYLYEHDRGTQGNISTFLKHIKQERNTLDSE